MKNRIDQLEEKKQCLQSQMKHEASSVPEEKRETLSDVHWALGSSRTPGPQVQLSACPHLLLPLPHPLSTLTKALQASFSAASSREPSLIPKEKINPFSVFAQSSAFTAALSPLYLVFTDIGGYNYLPHLYTNVLCTDSDI